MHKLNWISVGVGLATVHYGLGFLLGSGEAIYTKGPTGIVYAVSAAIGVLSLLFIAPFYIKKKKPIWDLLGDKYGKNISDTVAALSSFWMIGVIASQILGGAWVMSLLGVNKTFSMLIISILIYVFSILEIRRLSKVFLYLLVTSSLVLLGALGKLGINWIPTSIYNLIVSIPTITMSDWIGVVVTTILVTFLGMDFHQFLVKAENIKHAKWGIVLGCLILLVFSVLLLAVIEGSIKTGLVGNIIDAKQTIPLILLNFGNNIHLWIGKGILLTVTLVAVGSGSGVTRIVANTLSNFNRLKKIHINNNILTVVLALIIAVLGTSIIGLIVSFYAIYVASVLIPFSAYLLDCRFHFNFPKQVVEYSLWGGLLGSLITFFIRSFPMEYIFLSGLAGSMVLFCFGNLWLKKRTSN